MLIKQWGKVIVIKSHAGGVIRCTLAVAVVLAGGDAVFQEAFIAIWRQGHVRLATGTCNCKGNW